MVRSKLYFLTCDLERKLFGQVSHYLEMNKMHLIEKTFIRNRFEEHGRRLRAWSDPDRPFTADQASTSVIGRVRTPDGFELYLVFYDQYVNL